MTKTALFCKAEFINQDRHSLAAFAEKYHGNLIIIDEVQKEPRAIGLVKHLYDNFRMPFILTGSSEIKMRKGIGDSLTGRLHEVRLYPLTLKEIAIQKQETANYDTHQKNLLAYLIYGSLPQLLNLEPAGHENYLKDYINSVISKDVLEIAGTRKTAQVFLLAKLLALQIGQLVNFNELAVNTEFSRVTVYQYIDIFEQMGLVIKARPMSTNERESIAKATKIYITDLGVRNALVDDFRPFNQRPDKGQILENAVLVGIKKHADYGQRNEQIGFFRSVHGSEIDIVQKQGLLENLYEVKTAARPGRKQTGKVKLISLDNAQKFI